MDIFKNAALPQSMEHFHLLVLIAAINAIVFVPYIMFVTGSSSLAYWFNRKGRLSGGEQYNTIARSLIDAALFNKSLITFLAIIPGFSLVLAYAEMLQSTDAISAGLAGSGFVCLLIAFVLLYTYKYTFRVDSLLEAVQGRNESVDISDMEDYRMKNATAHNRSGKWGLVFLYVSVFLYAGALSVTTNRADWTTIESFVGVLISLDVWINFLIFLVIACGITGLGTIYFFLEWNKRQTALDHDVRQVIDRIGGRLAVISLLSFPIMILLNVFSLSLDVLSGTIYLLSGLALVLVFLSAHFLYGYWKLRQPKAIGYSLFMILSAVTAMTLVDHAALGNATKEHAAVLSARYEQATADLKAKLGVAMVVMTGEDIFTAKCSACHLFDQKKVGPPYNETIPKYNGDKAKIIAFVMNPAKINPAYPPMPNQGLKPAEADSIVSYLLSTVAGNNRQK